MSIIIGALGSILGYLGAAAATETFFERLLWPQRFYNDASLSAILKMAIFMTMAGPLHGAALESLDTFRNNGLYIGTRRGDMLGTTFLPDTESKNCLWSSPTAVGAASESRNGFWVRVLRHVKCENRRAQITQPDLENKSVADRPAYRAMQLVNHLTLRYASNSNDAGPAAVVISEASASWRTFLGIFISELPSIAIAVTAAVAKPFRTWWVAVYLCVPLMLKILSVLVSVRRVTILEDRSYDPRSPRAKDNLYEIKDTKQGFAVIQASEDVVRQFFRHYGHPIRDSTETGRKDRARELLSMGLVYAFVLYFPAGLISSLWMKSNVQVLWLSFQVYTVFAMHVVRILGWEDCGTTEGRVARLLEEKSVFLQAPGGYGVVATLKTTDHPSVALAKLELARIVEDHFKATAVESHHVSGKSSSVSLDPAKPGEASFVRSSTGADEGATKAASPLIPRK